MLNDMRRIALLILTLFPLLSQSTWAQPFVEITSTTGGMYACEGMTTSFIATPLVDGYGRWVVNSDWARVKGDVVSVRSVKEGAKIQLAYEFSLSNGTKWDTTFTVEVRPTTVVEVEQQGNRLVPVGKDGKPAPTEYQWRVDGKLSNEYRNVPFENPTIGAGYSLTMHLQSECAIVSGIVVEK